ncbi:MAG: type II toxin-antitoxin system RelE/ParE family toxin [Treponema sp.]|nr:type II toxin-antitoxin system RelE/ParE family toxin [Treponema sp.]
MGQNKLTQIWSDVYKVRVARPGEGKSGGHRVIGRRSESRVKAYFRMTERGGTKRVYPFIVYFKNEFRTLFAYGFSKSDRDNIDQGELQAF